MKYADLIQFHPIDSVIQLKEAEDLRREEELVQSYVMSPGMAEKLKYNMLSQLRLDEVIDNKGVLLVGNYGTGKSHLMSLISAVARDTSYLGKLQNEQFASEAKVIAGKFEVLRIEIGASQKPLRDLILDEVRQDFAKRELSISFPSADQVTSNKHLIEEMMVTLDQLYPGKGYLIVVDEFLDYLKGKKEREITLDLNFLRELGEAVKTTRLRVIFGVQEQLFENPLFSFVSDSLGRVKDRFEQVIIRKEDTAYVVSERILKKTTEQKAFIREHLSQFSKFYSNMSERLEEYVELFPIHPAYIDVLNKIYVIENRHILKNISDVIKDIFDQTIDQEMPGIISFDTYWPFIKDNFALRTDANIKEVVDKSEKLESIIERSFPKTIYKSLAIKIMYALSVHRLQTGDISLKVGLTSENLRDDLCLFIKGLPDESSDTLESLVRVILEDIMKTVSGQFIDHNKENGQYYLDLAKDLDYDELIKQRAATIQDDRLDRYFFDIIYDLMDWDEKEYVANFKIYEHTLNWDTRNIFRRGYLFLGTPEDRPTAQPPKDYYVYFLPPYSKKVDASSGEDDEVFLHFKRNEDFTQDLRLFAGASVQKEHADEKNRAIYHMKAEAFRKKAARYLNENRNTCFEVQYKDQRRQLLEVLGGRYNPQTPFKETMDLIASLKLDDYFSNKYPEYPVFKTRITKKNQADLIMAGYDRLAGKKTQQADALLESLGLLESGNISIAQSKYAQYYLKKLNDLPLQGVINFSDVYEEEYSGHFLDKKFKLDYALVSLVFLSMVYAGYAVLKTKDRDIDAADLEDLRSFSVIDIYEFKHLAKPKGLPLAELRYFFKVLGLPEGLINNPAQYTEGLSRLIETIKGQVQQAAKLSSKLNDDLSLWGEPLMNESLIATYRESLRGFVDEFSSFGNRFNTVAKLQNFPYGEAEIEGFAKDLHVIQLVHEYEQFYIACLNEINYMAQIGVMSLSKELSQEIADVKDQFRTIRDRLPEDMDGEGSAQDVIRSLQPVKKHYIDAYFDEHQKKRLNLQEGNRKGDLLTSTELENLDRLKVLSIFSAKQIDDIKGEIADISVCYELTPDKLKAAPKCSKCHFVIGSDEIPAKNRLDNLEQRLEEITQDWSKKLYNSLSDPTLQDEMAYLEEKQRQVIQTFLETKALPHKVDKFFIESANALLEGFETVKLSVEMLVDELDVLGPSDLDTVRKRLDEILNAAAAGKDKKIAYRY